jgi:uncharacterized membrane protein YqhA
MTDEKIPPGTKNSPDASGESQQPPKDNRSDDSIVWLLANSSKWLFALTVIGSALIAVVLFVYGFLLSLIAAYAGITRFSLDMNVIKGQLAIAIQIIDIFLVATVFYLISLGFYELFIAKAPLPGWVQIRNLDDLKTKLLGLTVIALAVIFLGYALTLKEGTGIFEFGAAVALMIAAISAYLWVKH